MRRAILAQRRRAIAVPCRHAGFLSGLRDMVSGSSKPKREFPSAAARGAEAAAGEDVSKMSGLELSRHQMLKQRALEAAHGEWVLSLDADEWIEADLVREIENVLNGDAAVDAYRMPRRNRFCGDIVRHGGWWPDYVLRLFKRGRARFSCAGCSSDTMSASSLSRSASTCAGSMHEPMLTIPSRRSAVSAAARVSGASVPSRRSSAVTVTVASPIQRRVQGVPACVGACLRRAAVLLWWPK